MTAPEIHTLLLQRKAKRDALAKRSAPYLSGLGDGQEKAQDAPIRWYHTASLWIVNSLIFTTAGAVLGSKLEVRKRWSGKR